MIGEQFADLPSTKNLDSEMEETSLLGGVSRRSSGKPENATFFFSSLYERMFSLSLVFEVYINVYIILTWTDDQVAAVRICSDWRNPCAIPL